MNETGVRQLLLRLCTSGSNTTAEATNQEKQQQEVRLARELLQRVSSTNVVSSQNTGDVGNTLLMVAAAHGKHWLLPLFVEAPTGMDVDHTNINGDTALMFGCMAGHEQAVHELLRMGADPTRRNKSGLTTLMCVCNCSSERSLDLAKTLLHHLKEWKTEEDDGERGGGGEHLSRRIINAQDRNGNTAMHFAVRRRNVALVQLLLEHGSDLSLRDLHQRTALDVAQQLVQAEGAENARDKEKGRRREDKEEMAEEQIIALLKRKWAELEAKAEQASLSVMKGHLTDATATTATKKKKNRGKNQKRKQTRESLQKREASGNEEKKEDEGEDATNEQMHKTNKTEEDEKCEDRTRPETNKQKTDANEEERGKEQAASATNHDWEIVARRKKASKRMNATNTKNTQRTEKDRDIEKEELNRMLRQERQRRSELEQQVLSLQTNLKEMETQLQKVNQSSLLSSSSPASSLHADEMINKKHLKDKLASLHPQAKDLDLRLSHLLGIGTEELSAAQLSALKGIHKQSAKQLTGLKKAHKLKQQSLWEEERIALQQELLRIASTMTLEDRNQPQEQEQQRQDSDSVYCLSSSSSSSFW
ncbi:hypothetical protein QOT17_007951 [Balamuthia mandrillaris]